MHETIERVIRQRTQSEGVMYDRKHQRPERPIVCHALGSHTRAVVGEELRQVPEIADGRIVDENGKVVPDEAVQQRIRVDQDGSEHERDGDYRRVLPRRRAAVTCHRHRCSLPTAGPCLCAP
jgi:hypothetical protein